MRNVSFGDLDALRCAAEAGLRRRQHVNLHASYADPCQRFLNAIEMDSYIRPHRHRLDPKAETLFAIVGQFAAIEFEETGDLKAVSLFGSESHRGEGCDLVAIQIDAQSWHTVIAMTTPAVLLEMKAGPFDPDAAKEFASWAPAEGDSAASAYAISLRRQAEEVLALRAGNAC